MNRFRAWRARRKKARYPHHQCEVCGVHLAPSERVEIVDVFDPTTDDGIYGGGAMTATYCHAHAPQEANA